MGLYLLGIFMGAIDTGIITPARTVIQRDLQVPEQSGIWMITIYTLGYAAAIPIMGKLADRIGRKPIYLVSIGLFGLGSLACGLSQDVGSFEMLIAARAVQAIGGGGILPIATAEIGTEVPQEKRGLALGLVGAVYGIANIFGASAGSLILDIAGTHNWQWIFYINVPISLLIVAAGVALLPNHRAASVKPIDVLGSLLLAGMILALLYGLRNLDFFDLGVSIRSLDVWPYLLAFVVAIPVFVLAERRAADPVLNLGYFTDRGVGLVLLLSLLSGIILMAVVFVPQFAENALRIPSGAGGYTVIALGLASGVGAPLSGRLTDRFGATRVLALGAMLSLAAAAVALWWTIPQPTVVSTFTALTLFGLGLGFIIGSPLNYMMLARTPARESNSALGSLSLVRAIGTTLAPAIMVGFLAQAGVGMQDRITAELPTEVPAPALPYADDLQGRFAAMKADPDTADQLAGVEFPDLGGRSTIDIDPNGSGELPADLVELLRSADVTNVVERTKTVARRMFAEQTPARVADITGGVQKGLDGLSDAATKLGTARADLASEGATMEDKLAEMATALEGMDAELATMATKDADLAKALSGVTQAIDGMRQGIPGLERAIAGMDRGLTEQRAGLAAIQKQRDALAAAPIPPAPPAPDASADAGAPASEPATTEPPTSEPPATEPPAEAATALAQPGAVPPGGGDPAAALAAMDAQADQLRAAIDALAGKRADAAGQLAELRAGLTKATEQRGQLQAARAGLATGREKLSGARSELATGFEQLSTARTKLGEADQKLQAVEADLAETRRELTVLRDAVPGAFDQALTTYLAEIDARAPRLEASFQGALGEGFRGVFLVYGIACLLLLGLLPLVPRARAEDAGGAAAAPADAAEGAPAAG